MKAIRLYAQVLVDVVQAPGSTVMLEKVLAELHRFNEESSASPVFEKVFNNPTLGDEDKQRALSALTQKFDLSALSSRFLSLLARRNRMAILADVLNEVEVIDVQKRGGLIGELVSAVPLEASALNGVQEALAKRLKKPVQLKQKVDASLIAGMRVTVSGVTYDGSVRGKLNQLAEGTGKQF